VYELKNRAADAFDINLSKGNEKDKIVVETIKLEEVKVANGQLKDTPPTSA
jgi:hypothetical protein